MNAVSSTNHTEMPSTPSVYQTLKRLDPGVAARRTASPRVEMSKPVTSGIVTAKLTSAATSAAQRTASARSSRPKASSSTPARIGSQIARLSKGMFLLLSWDGQRLVPSRKGQSCQVMRPMTPTIMTSAYQ